MWEQVIAKWNNIGDTNSDNVVGMDTTYHQLKPY